MFGQRHMGDGQHVEHQHFVKSVLTKRNKAQLQLNDKISGWEDKRRVGFSV